MNYVNRAPRGTIEVVQLVGDPIFVRHANLMGLDVSNPQTFVGVGGLRD